MKTHVSRTRLYTETKQLQMLEPIQKANLKTISLDYVLVETLYAYSLLNHINYNKFIYTLLSTSSPFFDAKEKVTTRNL